MFRLFYTLRRLFSRLPRSRLGERRGSPPEDRRRRDREILALALPALGALAAEPLYVLVDTAVVGNLGTPQLAGLALAAQVLLIIHAAFTFLAYGTTAVVARLTGAGRTDDAVRWGVQGLLLAAGAGAVLAGLLTFLGDSLLRLLGGESEVLAEASIYLSISLAGLPAMLMTLAGVGFLRGGLDTMRPLKVAAITAAGNLVLEVVLIFGLGYGIGASALSTVLAQWGAALTYLFWVGQRARRLKIGLSLDFRLLRRMAKTGGDLLIRTLILRGAFVAATAVAARIGTAELAAHQIVFELFTFTSLLLDALAIAGQGMVGNLLGAGDGAGARATGRRIIEWGLGLGALMAAAAFAVRPVLPQLFSGDPSVIQLTTFLMLHLAVMLPFGGVVFALDGVLIGAGDFRYLAWAMGASAAVFAPLLAVVGSTAAGVGWLWGAIWAFILVRLATLLGRFAGRGWLRLGAE